MPWDFMLDHACKGTDSYSAGIYHENVQIYRFSYHGTELLYLACIHGLHNYIGGV